MAVGSEYANQQIPYVDGVSGKPCIRVTTDGQSGGCWHVINGDYSSEAIAFNSASTYIVYQKNSAPSPKVDGIYIQALATGIETFLATAPYWSAPIFVGSEIFYFTTGGGSRQVRAV